MRLELVELASKQAHLPSPADWTRPLPRNGKSVAPIRTGKNVPNLHFPRFYIHPPFHYTLTRARLARNPYLLASSSSDQGHPILLFPPRHLQLAAIYPVSAREKAKLFIHPSRRKHGPQAQPKYFGQQSPLRSFRLSLRSSLADIDRLGATQAPKAPFPTSTCLPACTCARDSARDSALSCRILPFLLLNPPQATTTGREPQILGFRISEFQTASGLSRAPVKPSGAGHLTSISPHWPFAIRLHSAHTVQAANLF